MFSKPLLFITRNVKWFDNNIYNTEKHYVGN